MSSKRGFSIFLVMLLLAFAAGAGYRFGRKAAPEDRAYWIERYKYDELAAAADAQHKADLQSIAADQATITAQSAVIADVLAQAGQPTAAEKAKDKIIAGLAQKLADYEAHGDLEGALAAAKSEIAAWAEKFDLAVGSHQEALNALNKAWQVKFDAQAHISDTWKAAYEQEHSLRLAAESLGNHQARKAKTNKYLTWGGHALFFVLGNLSHR